MINVTLWGIGIDKIFMGLLAISAFVFLITILKEMFRSPEFEERIQIAKLSRGFSKSCRQYKKSPIVKKKFLVYMDKNCNAMLHSASPIIIDNTYLKMSSPFIKKSTQNKL